MTPADRTSVTLERPITVDKLLVSSLLVDPHFKIGWLRAAPTTPTWFIGILQATFGGVDLTDAKATEKVDVSTMLANIPTPSGEEVNEMVPWFLHVAEKATGQPAAVIDQLGIGDLVAILTILLPGMVAIGSNSRP